MAHNLVRNTRKIVVWLPDLVMGLIDEIAKRDGLTRSAITRMALLRLVNSDMGVPTSNLAQRIADDARKVQGAIRERNSCLSSQPALPEAAAAKSR
jgi:hypothetical protein